MTDEKMTPVLAMEVIRLSHTDELPATLKRNGAIEQAPEELVAYAEAIQNETDDEGNLIVGSDAETMTARRADLLAALGLTEDDVW
ncbi:hypothetical protein LAZ40_06730 [Cereibacter sphaeroides]|uniref:hypothetical protein n=1 Tax=Cereibacter sphaeroides TaxID=1063 RepID=UPI001F467758|nr:hypothetical protein [Cereibacter sphaeroides]MCE6958741.1 hypothetical protein [Cereibacter sphaeroides]MCE6973385.1 hypothetical protein [Cereibacter sphaeroides]